MWQELHQHHAGCHFLQFKARLHLLHKNVKLCKKEVKNLTSLTGAVCSYPHLSSSILLSPQTASAQFRKANVEFLRGNYRKAIKVLSSAPKTPHVTDAGECLSAYLFNAIGCIHFEMGRYSLAAHYFRRAVDENDAALNGFPPLDRGISILLPLQNLLPPQQPSYPGARCQCWV